MDEEGKGLIRHIFKHAADERLRHKIVFLEDYDIHMARLLVQGAGCVAQYSEATLGGLWHFRHESSGKRCSERKYSGWMVVRRIYERYWLGHRKRRGL